jgi:hypothetical protein
MPDSQKIQPEKCDNPSRFSLRKVLYHIWTELYSRYQEIFNPAWREPLSPKVCELCGKPGHKEAYCLNAKGLGLLE